MSAAAEAWVRGFADGWRAPSGAGGLADHFAPLVDPQIRLLQPQMPELVGPDALRRGFAEPLFALIPDLHATVVEWAVRGDVAMIEIELEGTLGGRPIALRAVDKVTLRDGLAIERRTYFDPGPLLAATLTRPRAWPRFVLAQAKQLRYRLRKGARNA